MAETEKEVTKPAVRQARTAAIVAQVEELSVKAQEPDEAGWQPKCNLDNGTLIVSTGCTLLDLAICGKRIRGGGLPTGIFIEIAGESGAGKTAVAVEIAASVTALKGNVKFLDPEGRLDIAYAETYGAEIDKKNYARPNTVEAVFSQHVTPWSKSTFEGIDVIICDSVAALSTDLEMDNPEGDKMGMRRAKILSQELRKTARIIAEKHRILIFTNQLRDGENGTKVTPGGNAIPFYSSVRLHMKPCFQGSKIEKEITVGEKNKVVKKVIGIQSEVFVKKNSIDDPFRKVHIPIIFGLGIDDIRSNLQYLKDMCGFGKYQITADGTGYVSMEKMIQYVEKEGLEKDLREATIDTWEAIEDQFTTRRKKKVRF